MYVSGKIANVLVDNIEGQMSIDSDAIAYHYITFL